MVSKTHQTFGIYMIRQNHVEMDLEKIRVVQQWPIPTNFKELSRFLGICTYYRRFIFHFAHILSCLYNLLRKEIKFIWNQETQKAFDTMKQHMISFLVLRNPNFDSLFIITCDASGYALGVILSQLDENQHEKSYVCAYASRILKGAEIHYTITEKECLAVIYAIKSYHIYLSGRKFRIITDHIALKWLMNIKEPTSRLARWAIYIQEYDFEIVHRAGRFLTNADATSRIPIQINSITRNNNQSSQSDFKEKIDPWHNIILLSFVQTGLFPEHTSQKLINKVIRLSEKLGWENDKLYYFPSIQNQSIRLEIPKPEDRTAIICSTHQLGHFSAKSTYDKIKCRFYWRNMIQDITTFIEHCLPCQRHHKSRIYEHPALALPMHGIFDRLGMDLVFGLPVTADGFKGILVLTEALTKYPYIVAIKSKSAIEIAQHFLEFICLFGPPKAILTDQGTEFVNAIITALTSKLRIKHTLTSAYHPRTNGLTERFNQTLIESLKKLTENNQLDWNKWLPYVALAYRSRINSVTKYSPFELMFGRKMNYLENFTTEIAENELSHLYKRAIELKNKLEYNVPQAKHMLEQAQEQQKLSQNAAHNINETPLPIGTQVIIKSLKLQPKLEELYMGPYTVHKQTKNKNYILINSKHALLRDSIPLSRIKVIPPTDKDTIYYNMETILRDRIKNGVRQYLVKWEGYDATHNSWEPASVFVSPKVIEDYWERKSKTNKVKASPSINSITIVVFTLMLFMLCITESEQSSITNNFKFCTHNKYSEKIDLQQQCRHNQISTPSFTTNVSLLEKRYNIIDGDGYMCSKNKIQITTHKTMFYVF